MKRKQIMRARRLYLLRKKYRWPAIAALLLTILPALALAPLSVAVFLHFAAVAFGAGCFGSIQYPAAGSIFYTQFTATDNPGLIDEINTALVTCGFTSNAITTIAQVHLPSEPDDNDTVTVGGITYKFLATLTGSANEVHRVGNPSGSVANLIKAITVTGTAGVDYGTGTVINPNVTAISGTSNGARIWTFVDGTDPGLSFTSPNGHISSDYHGYRLDMAATPQGLKARIWVEDAGADTAVRIRCATWDGVYSTANSTLDSGVTGASWLQPALGRTFEFCGCAHQFMVFVLSDSSTSNTQAFFTCPFLDAAKAPTLISGATNASPVQITAVGHGLATGQDVFIADVEGNTAANGFFTITKVDDDNFTLNGSTGSGAYTSSTGLLAGPRQIARCMFLEHAGATGNWRHQLADGWIQGWGVVNQYSRVMNDSGGPALDMPRAIGDGDAIVVNWGEIGDVQEANVSVRITGSGGTRLRVGRLWAAFLVREPIYIDRPVTAFDSHNWFQYLDGTVSANQTERVSLFFAKS